MLTKWLNFVVNMPKDTETIILDTARKQFIRKGFSGARMQEIADEADINKAMLHYYFRSKEKLYQEVVTQTLGLIIPKIAAAMEAKGTFLERTEHLVDTYIKTILAHPEIPMFIISELSKKQEDFILEVKKQVGHLPAIQSFIKQLTIEVKQGKIRDIPPVQLILIILGMTVFPFIAKPLISTIFGVSDRKFVKMMKERKVIIMDFIEHGLMIN